METVELGACRPANLIFASVTFNAQLLRTSSLSSGKSVTVCKTRTVLTEPNVTCHNNLRRVLYDTLFWYATLYGVIHDMKLVLRKYCCHRAHEPQCRLLEEYLDTSPYPRGHVAVLPVIFSLKHEERCPLAKTADLIAGLGGAARAIAGSGWFNSAAIFWRPRLASSLSRLQIYWEGQTRDAKCRKFTFATTLDQDTSASSTVSTGGVLIADRLQARYSCARQII